MTSLRIQFAGAGAFGLPTLRALLGAGHTIDLVISQPDRPAGRGRKLTPTPVAQFALDHNLPLLRTGDINTESLPQADMLLVIAFGQKIAEPVVHHARLGSINLHGSRLPRFRGAAPVHAAILSGDSITGNSIIRLAQKMDAGAVLGMSELSIGELETAGELHDRLAEDGASLTLRVIEELATGRAVEVAQDESLATIAPKMKREVARIDWTRPAEVIARQIRGLCPWPGCHVRITEADRELSRARLVRARTVESAGSAAPGQIDDSEHVAAAGSAVEIIELQPEGGRVMSLADFRNGHVWKPGLRVESI